VVGGHCLKTYLSPVWRSNDWPYDLDRGLGCLGLLRTVQWNLGAKLIEASQLSLNSVSKDGIHSYSVAQGFSKHGSWTTMCISISISWRCLVKCRFLGPMSNRLNLSLWGLRLGKISTFWTSSSDDPCASLRTPAGNPLQFANGPLYVLQPVPLSLRLESGKQDEAISFGGW
jgi:hypothetical protein